MNAPSKSQLAYDWVRERITQREYAPGYRLVLGPIADALGMSVVPVREAVRRLEAEGMVEFEKNVGARVVLVDEQEYVHTMQTLGVVEGVATSLSAPLLTLAQLAEARAINERLRALLDDFNAHEFSLLNQQFHTVLFTPCPNPHILDLVERGWHRVDSLRDTIFTFIPERARESVREHDRILDLIAAGADPWEIEQAARMHRWATMNAYLTERHTDQTTTLAEETS